MLWAIAVLLTGLATGQSLTQFEVASVRPSQPMQLDGGGGRGGGGLPMGCGIPRLTMNGGRVNFACVNVIQMIMYAYGVLYVEGPDWLKERDAGSFDVVAKLPAGATDSLVPAMFQRLLAERFKLEAHRGTKEVAGYALSVDKGGLKLRPASVTTPEVVAETDSAQCPPQNFNCAPAIRNLGGVQTRITPVNGRVRKISNSRIGVGTTTSAGLGHVKIEAPATTLEGLADLLTLQIGAPVTYVAPNAAAGEERYEVALDITFDVDPQSPDGLQDRVMSGIRSALEKGGLRLESRKVTAETVVVDRAQKTPTEN